MHKYTALSKEPALKSEAAGVKHITDDECQKDLVKEAKSGGDQCQQ